MRFDNLSTFEHSILSLLINEDRRNYRRKIGSFYTSTGWTELNHGCDGSEQR